MTLFSQVLAFESRPDPYPLYAQLRQRPIWQQADGTWVVSTYREIARLLADPRLSSDVRSGPEESSAGAASPPFLLLDPPDHDRLRSLVGRHFGPAVVQRVENRIRELVNQYIDAHPDGIDIVSDLAYPLPVTVICEILGVPPGDEVRFRGWSEALAGTLDPQYLSDDDNTLKAAVAHLDLAFYMSRLLAQRRQAPRDDLLSGLLSEPGLSDAELIQTAVLLLVAGHETTVNLISNGVLALLRHPEALQRLREHPDLWTLAVEEILRYDPPIQFRTRRAVADIDIDDGVIAAGSQVVLLLASGQRDATQFEAADRFDVERVSKPHLAFGLGIHFCFGAPLARLEGRIALGELVRRLERPRLLQDPPPYRKNPALRGPATLPLAYEGVRP